MIGRLPILVLVVACAACEREKRELRLDPPILHAMERFALMSNRIGGAPPEAYIALGSPYETNAYALSQGKRLYEWFNCQGCHADGGGNSGPPFLDEWWRYGPDIVSIVASLRDGRPRGMPSYRGKMTIEQMWQLAGYVQTIGSYSGAAAAPGRADGMQSRPGESRAPAASDPLPLPER